MKISYQMVGQNVEVVITDDNHQVVTIVTDDYRTLLTLKEDFHNAAMMLREAQDREKLKKRLTRLNP